MNWWVVVGEAESHCSRIFPLNHEYFMINLENLIDKQYVEMQEQDEQESIFFY